MDFSKTIRRLDDASMGTLDGLLAGMVMVRQRDLRELLFHLRRLDEEMRHRVESTPTVPDTVKGDEDMGLM